MLESPWDRVWFEPTGSGVVARPIGSDVRRGGCVREAQAGVVVLVLVLVGACTTPGSPNASAWQTGRDAAAVRLWLWACHRLGQGSAADSARLDAERLDSGRVRFGLECEWHSGWSRGRVRTCLCVHLDSAKCWPCVTLPILIESVLCVDRTVVKKKVKPSVTDSSVSHHHGYQR